MPKTRNAKFSIGQRIYHKLFFYIGVIFNVDAEFSGDEQWYDDVATSRPSKTAPWYHILPDGKQHTTYVAECNLKADRSVEEIDHPLLKKFFDDVNEIGYVSSEKFN